MFLFQPTKRTAPRGSVDDPRATDPGGAATDSSKHKGPTAEEEEEEHEFIRLHI